ncbi:hypothetical protein [Dactylosporangium roseum]|nr:hypothetical protein [Dactylosporangium roseum]
MKVHILGSAAGVGHLNNTNPLAGAGAGAPVEVAWDGQTLER